jgi:mannose-6-phosphate isomerase-like protein (cupin superfamily)
MPSALTLAHQDARRRIDECLLPGSSVQLLTVTSDQQQLAGHYDRLNHEVFVLVEGSGQAAWQLVDQDGQLAAAPTRFAMTAGAVLDVPPMVAHAFRLTPGSRLLCCSSTRFDPRRPDIIACGLEA